MSHRFVRSLSSARLRALGVLAGLSLPVAGWSQAAPKPSPAPDAAKGDELLTLSVFTVTSDKDEGYRSTQTISGSRTVENLKDIANSISIFNRELIDDLQVTTVAELSEFGIAGERNPDPREQERFVFRGVVNNYQLRDGFIWYLPVDTFSIERVEILRGPNAFLYGEAGPTGSINQITKRATTTHDFTRFRATYGSDELKRTELDVNRRLNDKWSVRANLAWQDADSYINHAYRSFKGLAFAVKYQPFKSTTLDVAYETGRIHENRPFGMLNERYSTTQLNGTTAALANTAGGYTLIPALGKIYNMVNTRVSSGLFVVVPDENVLPRELNFLGPDAFLRFHYHSLNVNFEQRVGQNLSLQATFGWQESFQYRDNIAGTGAASIYVDRNATLPDGTVNPYFNQYYTEYYHQRRNKSNIVRDVRVAAVYNLKLPFTTQRIIATALQHQDNPTQAIYSEYVDPTTSSFTGTFVNANTLAAFSTNTTTLTRNYFYRRFYLKDGDGANLTSWSPVAGRSVVRYDPSANGTAGRTVERRFYTPSYGIGSSGSYWGGKIRTMVGWRHDAFDSHVNRSFYNAATQQEYQLPERPREYTNLGMSAYNAGGVLHLTNWVSPFFNYAQAYSISLGDGGDGFKIGTKQGLPTGDGYETGLRWSLLGGKIESNWTYYVTNQEGDRNQPAPPAAATTELAGIFADFNTAGRDTQTVRSRGLEFETLVNLTKNWTLTWNYATNKVATADTLPQLRDFQTRAKSQSRATPNLDAFLATVIDGTPIRGYTRVRSNLVTRYRFGQGKLKGFSVGGGLQARDKSFLGNLDKNRDGVAEMVWAPGYVVYNLSLGYAAKVWGYNTTYALGVSNLFDKDYYRANTLNNASWNQGRAFRFSAGVNF
jgi:outer membrane receptor protein involved in Fe transport